MTYNPIPLDPQGAPANPNSLWRPVPVSGVGGGGGTVTWDDVNDKPSEFPATAESVEEAVAAKTAIAALTAIADPGSADVEAVAIAVNAVIAALQA